MVKIGPKGEQSLMEFLDSIESEDRQDAQVYRMVRNAFLTGDAKRGYECVMGMLFHWEDPIKPQLPALMRFRSEVRDRMIFSLALAIAERLRVSDPDLSERIIAAVSLLREVLTVDEAQPASVDVSHAN